MYALVLAEHAAGTVDVQRVVKMLLIHDIVEIDAGDVPFHVPATHRRAGTSVSVWSRSACSACCRMRRRRSFASCWFEFEAAESDDAKFAKALDRFQPMLHNAATDGGTWVECAVTLDQVTARCRPPIERGAPALWEAAAGMAEAHYRKDSGPD